MIKSFKHKGLEKYFETGSTAGIQSDHADRLSRQLATLNEASVIQDMNAPGWFLHPLTGNLKGKWSITVNKNWRIVFEFTDGDAYVANYEDYH